MYVLFVVPHLDESDLHMLPRDHPQTAIVIELCLVRFQPHSVRSSNAATMHPVASFQVRNYGDIPVIITASPILPAPVRVLPGETSDPIYAAARYSIQSEIERLPLPVPEIIVHFSPNGNLDVKAINSPSVKVDVIVNFDFLGGDLVLPSHITQSAHYF